MRALRQDGAAALPLRHLPEFSWLLFARDSPAPARPAAASAAQPGAGAAPPGLSELFPEGGVEGSAEGSVVCCDLSLDPPCKGMAGWQGEPSASKLAAPARSASGIRERSPSRLAAFPESLESKRNRRSTGLDWGGAPAATEFPWIGGFPPLRTSTHLFAPRRAPGSPRLPIGSPRLPIGSPRLPVGSPRLPLGSLRLP